MLDGTMPALWLEKAALTHGRAAAWLSLVTLLLFLPGFFTLPPMDRDEPRFAQATRQMLETGDYVAIRFQDEARNKKPVGIYWLQAGAVRAAETLGWPDARSKIWAFRLPSLLGAIGSVLLTYWAALPFMSRRQALVAALLLGSTLLLGVEARLAKTDAVVTLTVVAAMGALARLRLRDERGFANAAIFWTALAVGILVKGPITPMVPALAAAILSIHDRSARWLLPLRPAWGLAWCLLVVAPWLVLIGLKTGGGFFADSIGGDMLGKVAGAKEAHGAPPLSYFAAFWLTAWPMAPFAALAAPFVWRNWRRPASLFVLAWLVPSWLLFELVPTKLPHYVLPLYPAIALGIGLALDNDRLDLAARWRRLVAMAVPLVAGIVPLAVLAACLIYRIAPVWPFFVALFILLAVLGTMIRLIWVRNIQAVLALCPLLSLIVAVLAYSTVLTSSMYGPFAISPRLAQASAAVLAQSRACSALAPATAGFREPSLVFLTRTDLLITDGTGAAEFLASAACRIVFIEAAQASAFMTGVPDRRGLHFVERIKGINLNGGKPLDIEVFVRQEILP